MTDPARSREACGADEADGSLPEESTDETQSNPDRSDGDLRPPDAAIPLHPEPHRYVEPSGNPVTQGGRALVRSFRAFMRSRPGLTDLSLAVVCPIVLCAIDRPLLAKVYHWNEDGVVPLRPCVIPLVLGTVAAHVVRRILGGTRPVVQAHLAGALGAGSVVCFAIALVLLPFSLIGILFVGIGLLGLLPWATSLCLLRATWSAWRDARSELPVRRVIAFAATGAVALLAAAALTGLLGERAVARNVARVLDRSTPSADRASAIDRLRVLWWFPQVSPEGLLRDWSAGSDDPWTAVTGLPRPY